MISHIGYCPICERETVFEIQAEWLRDNYRCKSCNSIPRYRAIMQVIQWVLPNYKSLVVHEAAGGGPVSEKLARECKITFSQYFEDIPFGSYHPSGVRSENLESLTFPDESFDLFITQDVFEHVLDPIAGFKEVCRVLRPGGYHIFTVPYYEDKKTFTRAKRVGGEIVYLAKKDYHQGGPNGSLSLVVTDWGNDICEIIEEASGMKTSIVKIIDRYKGIDGKFLEVFVSRKHQ